MTGSSAPAAPTLPLVGRGEALGRVRAALMRAKAGRGDALFLTGPDGIGKSRLARAAAEVAEREGFLAARGCSFPMESGVPYALFCDLLDPLVRNESPEALTALTRGAPEFRFVCPSLVDPTAGPGGGSLESIPDLKSRLLWNFPGFLDRLRHHRPALFVLDDLQWVDPASVELLHFLARQVPDHPILIIGCVATDVANGNRAGELVKALEGHGFANTLPVTPLGVEEVTSGVAGAFGVDGDLIAPFAHQLYRWTGGNPLFLQASIDALVESGRLRVEGGRWVGWTLEDLPAPSSIQHLVEKRLEGLGEGAERVAEVTAVAGSRIRLPVLLAAADLDESVVALAIDEMVARGMLREESDLRGVTLTFVHHVVGGVLRARLGPARARLLHARIARALLAMEAEGEEVAARELAEHVLEAGDVASSSVAAAVLADAGRSALAAGADREAARFLDHALLRFVGDDAQEGAETGIDLRIDLARALQRTGRHEQATKLLEEARALAENAQDPHRMADIDRRLALGAFWAGRLHEALAHWTRGMEEADGAGDPRAGIRLRLAASACLLQMARSGEAEAMAREALELAEEEGDPELRAAAHRSLLLHFAWSGPPDEARRHGERALALAKELDAATPRFSTHWALAILSGLTGDQKGVRAHLDAGWSIARELGSPLLNLHLAEIEIEWSAGLGRWEAGMDVAEESIRMARELNKGMILSRLLIWSGLLHLARGERDVARRELDEAWERIGVDEGNGQPPTHLAILALLSRAALHLADGHPGEATRFGARALELVDRSGYRAWGIHRLLPLLIEAALLEREMDRAEALCRRLRADAECFGHPVGLVLADAGEALSTWLRGDVEEGARRMSEVAEALEDLGNLPEAARMRRQLAGRLADMGRTDDAVRELRRVHELFDAMGAEPELDKARGQFREVGSRPPVRTSARGDALLTEREEEIAHLVAKRKSNKAIGRELGISPRTVGTHLTNIYRKLDLSSRAELGDRVRAGLLEEG